jgi:hypothetical protein
MNIQRDGDGLLPDNRVLLQLHKYVIVSKYSWREFVKNKTVCEIWHGDYVGAVSSEKLAREVVAVLPYIKPCECTKMIKIKGIVVGLSFKGEARANARYTKSIFDEVLEGKKCIK